MPSPLAAVGYGLVAGALGAGVQSLFFEATRRWTPKPPEGAFEPPEERQRGESETATVARRVVEGLMQRGPLSREGVARGAQIVHFGFGAGWGGLYALVRETTGWRPTPVTALGFGTLVWAVSDNGIVPAFRLAAGPRAYPLKSHAYALAAHFAYGAGVSISYELLRSSPLLRSALEAYLLRWSLARRVPSLLRGPARPVLQWAVGARSKHPARRLVHAWADLRDAT